MRDTFAQTVDELGEEALGLAWLHWRDRVQRWIDSNPERVEWLCRRLRRLVREGRV